MADRRDFRPEPDGGGVGAVDEVDAARRALASLDPIADRVGTETRRSFTGRPLAVWGAVWVAGYLGVQHAPPVAAVLAWVLLCLTGLALTWNRGQAEVRTGREPASRRGWIALFATSPLVLAVTGPTTMEAAYLQLGALWAAGFAVYGATTRDGVLTILSGWVLVAAVAATSTPSPSAVFGVASGAAMIGMGLTRHLRGASAGRRRR